MELDVARIEKYVRDKYPKIFKDEPLIITENQSFYLIKRNNNESPLILSKNI
jgi:hypothetical protein